MNKLIKASFIAASLSVGLSGCIVVDGGDYDRHSSDWQDREYDNRRNIARLSVGEDYQSVLSRLGDADFTEFYKQGDDQVRVLFYRTHRNRGDGVTTKDECTPLVFKNDLLDGWGNTAYQQL